MAVLVIVTRGDASFDFNASSQKLRIGKCNLRLAKIYLSSENGCLDRIGRRKICPLTVFIAFVSSETYSTLP